MLAPTVRPPSNHADSEISTQLANGQDEGGTGRPAGAARPKGEANMIWTRLCGGLVALSLVGCAVDTTESADDAELGEATQEVRRNALSNHQEATALKLIDDICGDTWCEGDHNFRFDRLECQKGCGSRAGTCQLTFRLFSYDTEIDTGPTYERSCRTGAFTGFDSLVSTQGSYQSLQPAYYDALSECISRVESALPQ
jgi:hypothetical protein